MRKTWKLIALAALGALGGLALLPGGGAPPLAQAATTGINVSSTSVSSGGTTDVQGVFNTDEEAIIISNTDLTGGISGVALVFLSATVNALPVTPGADDNPAPGTYELFNATMAALDGNGNAEPAVLT